MSQELQSSHFVKANGLELHYHEVGPAESAHGEPLILIHGGGPGATGWSNYSRNVAALSKRYRTLLIDLPGYGKSAKQFAKGSLFEFMSDAVLAFMDALRIDKASFIGNSLGGGTSLKLCYRFPERVQRLILMGPAGSLPMFSPLSEGGRRMFAYYMGSGPSLEKLKGFIEYMVHDPSQISDELLQQRFEASRDPQVIANPPLSQLARRHAADELWRDRLSEIKHPTLIIWGREDRTCTLDSSFVLMRALPNAELHVFPNCGHWAQWEKADEFNTLVLDFLSRT